MWTKFIEQSASVGVLVTAMACPACWPLFALAIGLGSAAMILYGFYVGWQLLVMYLGIFGMLLAFALSYLELRKVKKICEQ